MPERVSVYEERIRARFPALVADPLWPTIECLVREEYRDSDEFWWTNLQQICIDVSKRLGLAIGPQCCAVCDKAFSDVMVPDGVCTACATGE